MNNWLKHLLHRSDITMKPGDVYRRNSGGCGYPIVVIEKIVEDRVYFRKERENLEHNQYDHSIEVFKVRFTKL